MLDCLVINDLNGWLWWILKSPITKIQEHQCFVIINKWYVKKYALHSQSKLFHTSSQILANEKEMKSTKKNLDRNEEFVICICTKVVHILFMWNMVPVVKIQKI